MMENEGLDLTLDIFVVILGSFMMLLFTEAVRVSF